MQFQNPILNFKGWTHGRKDGRTSPNQYAPSTFSSWGIIKVNISNKLTCTGVFAISQDTSNSIMHKSLTIRRLFRKNLLNLN